MNSGGHNVLRIGHRGAAGHATENTVQAFRAAVNFGVDFVETDLRVTADGEIVLLHDKSLRAFGREHTIARVTLARLREIGQALAIPILTLRELIALLEGSGIGVMLEVKVVGIIDRVHAMMQHACFSNPIIYASFHHDEIRRLRDVFPYAQTLALIDACPVDRSRFVIDADATHAGINFELADDQFIAELHRAGVKVFAYTVNEVADIERLIAEGVDGIISDYPDRVPRSMIAR